MRLNQAFLLTVILAAPPAFGNETTQQTAALVGSMARFAQPVRVGDLAHRDLLRPEWQQGVLGTVASPAMVQAADGTLFLVVDWGGLLGIGTTRVVVPADSVALLGEHLVLVRMPTPRLAQLGRYQPSAYTAVAPERQVRVMIVGPYH